MPHKFDPKKMDHLESHGRRKLMDAEEILSSLPLDPGQSVVDIGCGTGFFAVPLSKRLPQGKVYALDIADEMLERLRQKVQDNGIGNIEIIKSGEMEFPVPEGAMDGAVLSAVLHEQEDRIEFLKRVRDLLKPGAWLLIVEWQKKESPMGPSLEERIDEAELRDMASQARFRTASARAIGEFNYMAVLTRSGDPGSQ